MSSQLIVTSLNSFQAFSGFASRDRNQAWVKARFRQRLSDNLSIPWRYIMVGNNGAPLAKFEAGAFRAQLGQQVFPDQYGITAVAQRYLHSTHAGSIEDGRTMSKICRLAENNDLLFQVEFYPEGE
jgi:hypothetical protein